jgi:glycerophosphoryl diester phosphodiesterase
MKKLSCYLIFAVMLFLQPETVKGQQPHHPEVNLIAHRGGVVDENHAENSRASILTAIERGYWMLEVDIRETRDGRAILHHDTDFSRFYNDPRRVEEMDWDEIKLLRSDIDGERPILFSEAAGLAADRIRFMLDVKGNELSEGFYREIEEALNHNNLMETTFILSSAQAKEYFHERTSHSINYNGLLEAAEAGEDVSNSYHLFMLASRLTEEMVRKASELGVVVVAAVNEFRYVQDGKDTWEGAKRDVERLLGFGVQYYQIDSVYEPLFK